MTTEFDVIVVGAGPAGLFACLELTKYAQGDRLRVLVIDRGSNVDKRVCQMKVRGRCGSCRVCNVLHGVGGAGALSSGILNLRPDIGGSLHELTNSWSLAQRIIDYVDSTFVRFGAPKDRLYEPSVSDEFKEFQRKFIRIGAQLVEIRQRHLGTENAISVVKNMYEHLRREGVKFMIETTVTSVERRGSVYVVKTDSGHEMSCSTLLLAPGRSGAEWFKELSKRVGIQLVPNPLDIGVRVEVPQYVMEPITKIYPDPKIVLYTKTYDDKVRTFCTNPGGFVIKEVYERGIVGVNGETYVAKTSQNTNFALLVSLKLTDPLEDTIEYGRSIAKVATKLGGGRPLVQRLGDLRAGRRSTWDRIRRSIVEPTLKDVTPGDIAMAYPHRVITDILEALDKIDDVLPGVASKHTLLYAPEVKYYSMRAVVNKYLETTAENIFVAGDGAGLSRGLCIAAATGVIAAWGILLKLGVDINDELFIEYDKRAGP